MHRETGLPDEIAILRARRADEADLDDAMRTSGAIASLDVAVAAMRDKGLDPDNDPVTRTDFVRRVTLQLNDLVRRPRFSPEITRPLIMWRMSAQDRAGYDIGKMLGEGVGGR
jgi:hypothetical protein